MAYVLMFSEVPDSEFKDYINNWQIKDKPFNKMTSKEKFNFSPNAKYLKNHSVFNMVDTQKELFDIIKKSGGPDLAKNFKERNKYKIRNNKARLNISKFIKEYGFPIAENALRQYYKVFGDTEKMKKEEFEAIDYNYWGYKNTLRYVFREDSHGNWIELWNILKKYKPKNKKGE